MGRNLIFRFEIQDSEIWRGLENSRNLEQIASSFFSTL